MSESQCWIHNVSSIQSKEDVCSTCSGIHRTTEHMFMDRKEMKYANCKAVSHPSWDCMFPTFVAKIEAYDRKHPKNIYKY